VSVVISSNLYAINLEERVSSRGLKIWRRSARNTPPSFALSFGKIFPVAIVYSLSPFSVLKMRTSTFEPWTKSTRFTCFLVTACIKEDALVLQGEKWMRGSTTHGTAFPKGIGRRVDP
jgi:hypothetical protein